MTTGDIYIENIFLLLSHDFSQFEQHWKIVINKNIRIQLVKTCKIQQ